MSPLALTIIFSLRFFTARIFNALLFGQDPVTFRKTDKVRVVYYLICCLCFLRLPRSLHFELGFKYYGQDGADCGEKDDYDGPDQPVCTYGGITAAALPVRIAA